MLDMKTVSLFVPVVRTTQHWMEKNEWTPLLEGEQYRGGSEVDVSCSRMVYVDLEKHEYLDETFATGLYRTCHMHGHQSGLTN